MLPSPPRDAFRCMQSGNCNNDDDDNDDSDDEEKGEGAVVDRTIDAVFWCCLLMRSFLGAAKAKLLRTSKVPGCDGEW